MRRFSIWTMWKSPDQKQRMSNFTYSVLDYVYGVLHHVHQHMPIDAYCYRQNHNNRKAEHTNSEQQQTITVMNKLDEDVPLSHVPQAAKPVFEADLTLLSSVALSVTWFLEFLARLTRKLEKKKIEPNVIERYSL